jgi:hypothetical protein
VSIEPSLGTSATVRCPLSVVINNHNYAGYVDAAIESALAQRDVETDVVVVDDGSTDDSLEVIRRHAGSVTIASTTNAGQGAAINLGFALSRGETVIFLDADDVLWPDTGRRVVATMRGDPSLARVQFALEVIDDRGHRSGGQVPAAPRLPFSGDATARLLSCPDDIVWQPTSGNAFRRSALAEVLPMPVAPFRLCADYYLSNLVPLHGRVGLLPQPGGGYRVHGANGHYATAEDPERLRANIVRTIETHRCLITEARRLGLRGLPLDPTAVRSVSSIANRLLSYRVDKKSHPLPDDNRLHLLGLGVASAVRRGDVPAHRRAAFAAWFLAMAVSPRRLLPAVARPFIQLNGQFVSTPDRLGTARHPH